MAECPKYHTPQTGKLPEDPLCEANGMSGNIKNLLLRCPIGSKSCTDVTAGTNGGAGLLEQWRQDAKRQINKIPQQK